MKRLYEKSELGFSLAWIGIYCLLMSLANGLNELIGTDYAASAALAAAQLLVIVLFLRRNHLEVKYGLCHETVPARLFLYYVPLIVLATAGLWNGVALNYAPAAAACRIVTMLCVGFLEEIIFRGFLFRALLARSAAVAVVVSSVTFGLGHAVNAVNGSGMDLLSNLCQIAYAVAFGFLFVIIFWRSGSLLPCAVTHAAINCLSTFGADPPNPAAEITQSLVICAIAAAFALYLNKALQRPRSVRSA